jgi:subtilisin family serine protease
VRHWVQPETLKELTARQLIVLFDLTNSSSPAANAIVDAVRSPSNNSSLNGLLGHPSGAHTVLTGITPVALQTELAKRPKSSRARLEQYVVLTYPTATVAKNMKALLEKDPRVLSVEFNKEVVLSAQPSDRYFAPNTFPPTPGNYQWGMEALNVPAAWDKVRGNAYLGAVDMGIVCPSTSSPCITHPDLQQNFRHQFSRRFFAGVTPDDLIDEDISVFSWLGTEYRTRGHGTHVAGIISATPQYGQFDNHQSNSGVAGICWTCSFAMLKMGRSVDAIVAAIAYGIDHGLQSINMSWRVEDTASTEVIASYLDVLSVARARDVVMVAASGNRARPTIDFPARVPGVIAVGGLQVGSKFWNTGYGIYGNVCPPPGVPGDECGSNYGPEQAVVAPAKDVVSTVYPNFDHNFFVYRGDSFGPDGGALDGYGDCTGTSMSAPHVTGIVGLLRSVNPLLDRDQIRTLLTTNTTPCIGADSDKCGAGIPDAGKAVTAAMGGPRAVNRLTPLFSFYSAAATDHFYTTVPQMALAALTIGGLLPQPSDAAIAYDAIGDVVSGYSQFPTPPCTAYPCFAYAPPRANLSVFVSHVNPVAGAGELLPLYRYSWTNSSRVSHVYSANQGENWPSVGYTLDGIEGYIYPPTQAQPIGTVKVCRKYDALRDDYVLFAGAGASGLDCSATSDGLTGGNYQSLTQADWIGWAYSVREPQPVCGGAKPCRSDILPALMLLLLD